MDKVLNEVSDAMNGLDFLRNSRGKYKLLAATKDDGTISVTLNEIHRIGDNASVNFPVFELDMGGIYSQCAPAKIIERLNRNIQEAGDMIEQIRLDAPKTEIALTTTDEEPF